MKKIYIILLVLVSFLLVSCSNDENIIVVAASPNPHSEILKFAAPLIKEKGYKLEIKIMSDYITPNQALTSNQVDANYFQHEPYLDNYNKEYNTNILSVAKIHIEPIGIYSKKYKSLDEIEDGATIAMSNSPTDQGRLLNLLVNSGLITLNEGINPFEASIKDIKDNYKNLVINSDIDPETLIDVYKYNQADLVLINSNFALSGGLEPGKDAISKETPTNNPYANILAVLEKNKDSEKIKVLIEVLTSKEVSDFITEKWNGDIVPAK